MSEVHTDYLQVRVCVSVCVLYMAVSACVSVCVCTWMEACLRCAQTICRFVGACVYVCVVYVNVCVCQCVCVCMDGGMSERHTDYLQIRVCV